jgi:hypothetical protein
MILAFSTPAPAPAAQTVVRPFGAELFPTGQTIANGGDRLVLDSVTFPRFGDFFSSRQFTGRKRLDL